MARNQIVTFEEQLLSTIIFSGGELLDSIADILKDSDFILPMHSCMFRACQRLSETGDTIDENTVCMEMQKEMEVTIDDVVRLSSHAPLENLDSYIKMIKDTSIKRELVKLAGYIHKESTESKITSEIILNEIESRVFALSIDKYTKGFIPGSTATKEAMKHLQKIKELQTFLVGIDTGFSQLNHITTGFNNGELIVIGARPAMGKTALILSMILKTLSGGKGVALFNLEMSTTELMLRMFSARSRIPMQDIRQAKLSDSQWNKLTKVTQDLCDIGNFYIDDGHNLTLSNLRSKLRKLKTQDRTVAIAFIDYLQLMQSENGKNMPRHEEIAEISRGLKKLARELDIPIVALAQLNRSLEYRDDKRPILSDLKESGAIEQDADIIVFIYRDEVYKERDAKHKIASARKKGEDEIEPYIIPQVEEVELIVAKNRNGEIRTIKVQFEKQFTLFVDRDEYMVAEMESAEGIEGDEDTAEF